MAEKTVEIVEELMPMETPPEMLAVWDEQERAVRRIIENRIDAMIDEKMLARNAMYFRQSEEGLEALAEELVQEVAEYLLP